jgi:hypothetical protein
MIRPPLIPPPPGASPQQEMEYLKQRAEWKNVMDWQLAVIIVIVGLLIGAVIVGVFIAAWISGKLNGVLGLVAGSAAFWLAVVEVKKRL